MRLFRRARAGFSLTEFAIVLCVMGIVIGTLWNIVPTVTENTKRKEAAAQLIVVVKNIRDFYSSRTLISNASGSGLAAPLTSYLIERNLLLPEQIRNRTTGGAGSFIADNPWSLSEGLAGGGFLVCSAGAGCAASNSAAEFDIQLLGLKRSSCAALAAEVSGPSGPPGLLRVYFNGGSSETLPVVREDALTKCAATGNTVHFVFRLRQH